MDKALYQVYKDRLGNYHVERRKVIYQNDLYTYYMVNGEDKAPKSMMTKRIKDTIDPEVLELGFYRTQIDKSLLKKVDRSQKRRCILSNIQSVRDRILFDEAELIKLNNQLESLNNELAKLEEVDV